MVYALWNNNMSDSAIEQLTEVVSNLHCILRQLIHEQKKNDKAVESRKSSLLKQKINSFKYFKNKGIMCLNMANKFHEWNWKSRTMFGLLMKNMDNYTKLRKEYERITYNMDQLAERKRIYDNSFLIFNNNNMLFENGVFANENEDNMFELEEQEIVEFYGWINKVDDRKLFLIGIETKLYEIQDAFFERCFSLYHELNDYCTELRQYLCNDKYTLKSHKYRKKNLGKFVCCRYRLLKLLKRINKHKKCIAKYNPTYKENKWKR